MEESLRLAMDRYSSVGLVVIPLTITKKVDPTKPKGYAKVCRFPTGYLEPENWKTDSPLQRVESGHNALALLTGPTPNKLFAVDVDNIDDWTDFLAEKGMEEPVTWKQMSLSGLHLLFKYDERFSGLDGQARCLVNDAGERLDVDIRTTGNCLFSEPTTIDGKSYRWLEDQSPWTMPEPAPMPDWLFSEIMNGVESRGKKKKLKGGGARQPVAELVVADEERVRRAVHAQEVLRHLPDLNRALFQSQMRRMDKEKR